MTHFSLIDTTGNPYHFGIHQTIKHFTESLVKPNNYPRIVKQYLKFTIKHNYFIDEVSKNLFLEKYKAGVYHTACNRFLDFAQKSNIRKVYDDTTPKYTGNATVLYFLSEAQIAENSKETYSKALQEFYKFLNQKKLAPIRTSVLGFMNHCQKNGLSPYTINNYLAAIKQFIAFCVIKRNELNLSVDLVEKMRDVEYVKNVKIGGTVKKYAKESLSEAERQKLLDAIDNPKEKAVIALMAYQGLRTIEVIRLEWEDIKDVKGRNFLAVKGKGRTEKELIPLLDECRKIVIAYQVTETRPTGSMFNFSETSSIRKITNKWLKETGLKREGISAHSLRHTVAQLMLDKGIPKNMVRRFLRHKNELATNIYTAQQEDRVFLEYSF